MLIKYFLSIIKQVLVNKLHRQTAATKTEHSANCHIANPNIINHQLQIAGE